MNLLQTALVLLIVAPASALYAVKKPTSTNKDLDSFSEQADEAKAKHLSSKSVEESHLRGSTPVDITSMQNRNNRARQNAWLDAHNDARLAFQGEDAYNEMEWSNDLFNDAKDHAEELVVNCTTKAPTGDLNDYGWNIAGAQNTPDFRSVDEVFNLWESKLINGWPNNKEYSQVLWRSTEYVGCADAAADEDDMKCTFSVCFYARAGNCGMGQIENWADHANKIMNGNSCGPCPTDHPDCPGFRVLKS